MAQEGDNTRCDVYECMRFSWTNWRPFAFLKMQEQILKTSNTCHCGILMYGVAARHSKATAHENEEGMCFVKA